MSATENLAEEVERLRRENAILRKEREACWKEIREYPIRDDCMPDLLPDRIREIVIDAKQMRAGLRYAAGLGRSADDE